MGFDGAASFSEKTGAQARPKKHAPHAVFVHSLSPLTITLRAQHDWN